MKIILLVTFVIGMFALFVFFGAVKANDNVTERILDDKDQERFVNEWIANR